MIEYCADNRLYEPSADWFNRVVNLFNSFASFWACFNSAKRFAFSLSANAKSRAARVNLSVSFDAPRIVLRPLSVAPLTPSNAALTVIASDLIFCNVFIYASLNWSNCAINFVILSSGFTRSLYFIGLLLSAILNVICGQFAPCSIIFSF